MSQPSAETSRRHFLTQLAGASGLIALSSALPAWATGSPRPLATTRSGRIAGQLDHGIHVFRGVPYGADTAPRRFQRALREAGWNGVRDARSFGASAPQRGDADGRPMSEDCLFLNVYTPALRDGRKRPILFYIHGGGYTTGSGSHPLYDGVNLCRRGDVVVVTVNHRLNAFGYLYLAESGDERLQDAGNVGQLDLVDALHWVREHAHEFGGDASNVTVFGQSGGGAKIATLMAMPEADGLFHKAMTMSGQQVTAAGPRAAAQRTELFLAELGLGPRDVDRLLALPMARLVDALRTRDPSRVEDTALYFGPVLDSRSLPRHPFYPNAPAQSARIPMVIGNTRDETRAFLGNDPANFTLTWEQLPQRLREQQFVDLSPDVVIAEYRRLYPDYTPSEIFFAATTAGRSWRGAVIEAEERAKQGAPAWVYQLDWRSLAEDGRLRAFHTLDIPLIFDTIGAEGSKTGHDARARAMAAHMSEALIALARHGDPNHAGIPAWSPYTLPRRQTMVFDEVSRLQDDPRGGERRLYERVPFVQRGTF
ncbi:carboxylesterase/lipase family protein [Pseudoxanthomonas sp. PXM02]|uniref:carboxylesterase/lipase family protein n=1 Tax=Pseudoxanthomonas sp. PXM02 TaxID=2769294 RepID=UPI00177F6861|nr:carboxylesterase/lipase family protein [Pseudoxanthomonas sp. PXM02]MBD9477620.1 carboxylesterase/lipase family protein [Pseudoxanthomonas sp. PXM02]